MGVQSEIPVIVEKPLAGCGSRKFQIDPLGDHLSTCTAYSGLFRTTHKENFEAQLVAGSRGSTMWVPLVLDLRITHDRFGSSADPNLNGHLHYPNNIMIGH